MTIIPAIAILGAVAYCVAFAVRRLLGERRWGALMHYRRGR